MYIKYKTSHCLAQQVPSPAATKKVTLQRQQSESSANQNIWQKSANLHFSCLFWEQWPRLSPAGHPCMWHFSLDLVKPKIMCGCTQCWSKLPLILPPTETNTDNQKSFTLCSVSRAAARSRTPQLCGSVTFGRQTYFSFFLSRSSENTHR